jgi:ATP-dependent DNA helicase PIF1
MLDKFKWKVVNTDVVEIEGIKPRNGIYVCDPDPYRGKGLEITQPECWDVMNKHSIIMNKPLTVLYGPGGTGKTWTIKRLAEYWDGLGITYQITTTTGIASTNFVDARTIHSWCGFGIKIKKPKDINKFVLSKIMRTEIMVLDEMSMLNCKQFEMIESILRYAKNPKLPWGGMKVVLSGDFQQLPPVEGLPIYRSKLWAPHTIKFYESKRFTDQRYFEFLLRLRKNKTTPEDFKLLQARLDVPLPQTITPTIVMGYNRSVVKYNNKKLEKLKSPAFNWEATDEYDEDIPIKMRPGLEKKLNSVLPQKIILKVGAQVMIKYNIDTALGLCNGTRGVVTKINYPFVMVETSVGIYEIKPIKIQYEVDKMPYERYQLPLVLAWAITSHKSQGLTIDAIQCDLNSEIFQKQQLYVILSRVRSFDSLWITNLNKTMFI